MKLNEIEIDYATVIKEVTAELDGQIREANIKRGKIVLSAMKIAKKRFTQEWVGACFKYSTSYGRGKKRWWVYVRITEIDYTYYTNDQVLAYVYIERFQRTQAGRYEFEMRDHMCLHSVNEDIRIDQEEYLNARSEFLNELMFSRPERVK